jgi:chorismate--pyruvate lyase
VSVTADRSWRSSLMRAPDNVSLMPWLRDRGSLTARIQARGRFAVRVLRQGLDSPTADEALALGLPRQARAWVREVALSCDGQIVVFAHTVLPHRPRGPLSLWLARLGNRSLGALLFAHPGFERGTMKFKRLDRRQALFTPALAALQLADGGYERALGTPLAVRFRRAIRPGDRGLFTTRAATLTIRKRKLDEAQGGCYNARRTTPPQRSVQQASRTWP